MPDLSNRLFVQVRISVRRVQSSAQVLPEQSRVLSSLGPAQVGVSLHQPPHLIVGRQLLGWNVLQEHQDQHVLLFIKQTVAAHRRPQHIYHSFKFKGDDHPFSILNYVINIPKRSRVWKSEKSSHSSVLPRTRRIVFGMYSLMTHRCVIYSVNPVI